MRKLKLFLTLLMLMCIGVTQMWGEEKVSTLTFTAAAGGSGTADDAVDWTVTSDGTESTYDATKGIHYGTGSAQVTYIQLATSGISGTITKVVVNASTASGVTASASVTVGGSAFGGDPKSLSATATNYTFDGSASGEIVVRVAKPSKATKAIYVKSVAVTYTTGGDDPTPPTPTLSSIEVATAPTTLTYTEGDVFDPTGLVITRTFSSGDPDTYVYAGHTEEFSFEPSLSTALTTSDASVTITYGGKSTTQNITVNAASSGDEPGGGDESNDGLINFGSADGSTNISGTSVTGDDSRGQTWTITTAGTTSFTPNAQYAQIGSSKKPATSITFTTTLNQAMTVSAFSAKFGGFSGTAGTVTLKVDDTTVGSGSLDGTTDVTINASNTTTSGTVLTVTVTGIDKGVKAYYISYTVASTGGGDEPVSPKPVITFSPEEGSFCEAQNVTLSSSVEGATIYYSIDDADPSTLYTGVIAVSETTTIKAYATKDNTDGDVASATFTITAKEDPTITPTDGNVEVGKTLDVSTLFSSNSVGAITYSITAGDAATIEGNTLSAVKAGSVTVQASQEANGCYNAKTATAPVTVTAPLPTITITAEQIADFTNTYAEYDWTASGVSGKTYAYKNAGIQLNSDKAGHYVYNTTPVPGNITKITMTKASGSARTWTPYVSDEAMTTTVEGKNITSKEVASTTEWEVTGSNQYFYLNVAGGSTVIGSIVITYEPILSAVTVEDEIAHGSVAVSGAEDLTAVAAGTELTLTNTPSAEYQLKEYNVYKTGDATTKIAVTNGKFIMPLYDVTVSAEFEESKELDHLVITSEASQKTFWVGETFNSTGLTIKAVYDNETVKENVEPKSISTPDMNEAGPKTVTIAYEEKGIEKTTSYEITVKALPTEENPASVAEIRDIYDKFGDTENMFVRGTIYKINGFYSEKYISYWITDAYAAGENPNHTNEFELYNGLDFNEASFTAQTDLELGQEVVVKGNLTRFGSSAPYTYEFSTGNIIISRPKYVKSIALNEGYNTAFNDDEAFSHEGVVVTATYNYGADADVTATAEWSEPDMTQLGEQEVTVSYTYEGKTVEFKYTITITHVCAPENLVAVTKGEEDNTKGTYTVVEENVCTEGDGATVDVADIVPAEGYRFKEITTSASGNVDNDLKKVTGIKAATTITVVFEEIPTHQVTWNVNGDETTKTTVQEGSKPIFPTPNPASCDATSTAFYGWATAPWTGKAENLNEKTVYTSAADMDPVTAEGTKYYAVFAKATPGDPVPMTLWSEDFSSYKADDVPKGGSPISYSVTNGSGTTKVYTTQLGAGGDSPELLVAKNNGTFTASGIATNGVSSATLTYHTNQTSNLTVTTTAEHVTIGSVSVDGTDTKLCTRTITFAEGAPETFDLTFTMTTGSNSRLDDIVLSAELSSVSYSEYLTTCCTKYNVTIDSEIENGIVSAEPAQACEGETVTMTFTPSPGYHLDAWTVNEAEQDVNANTFAMPENGATVSATFAHDPCTSLGTPANVQVAADYKSAMLDWDDVENADHYVVTIKKGVETVESNIVDESEYEVVATLLAKITYTYEIQATADDTQTHCPSALASADFETEPLPTAHLILSENGEEFEFEENQHKLNDVVTLPSELHYSGCTGKVLKGWSKVAVVEQDEEPTENYYAAGTQYTIGATADKLYAVYATEGAGQASTLFSETFDACNGTGANDDKGWSGSIASVTLPNALSNSWAFVKGNAAYQCAKFGTGSAKGSAETPTIELTGAATLTFKAGAWNGGSEGTTLNLSATGATLDKSSVEMTKGAWTSYTVAITNANGSVKIKFEAKNASNNRFFLDDVVVSQTAITYSDYTTTCAAALEEPTFSPAAGVFTEAQTVTISGPDGATIYYTLDGTEPTIESDVYSAPIVLENKCGNQTIKAFAKNGNSESAIVSATYTLNLPMLDNSEANPYTPAQAIAVYDGNGYCYDGETMVYVKGVVKTSSGLNSQYGNYDNIVVVAEETTSPEFTFFHMYKGSNKVHFEEGDVAIEANDTIEAYGKIVYYSNGDIYEFADGCYLIGEVKKYSQPKTSIVNDPEHPYTIAQAIGFIDEPATYDLSDSVWVKAVANAAPTNAGTFTAHDADVENSFQFYNTKLDENTIVANDTVIVKGIIKKVNTTYRMDAGRVVEVKGYVAPVVPMFTVNPATAAFGNVEKGATVDPIEITVELTAIQNATVTLADDNNVFSIDVTSLTENGIITVTANTDVDIAEYAATITLHDVAEAAEDVVINVSMNVTAVDPRHKAQDIDGFDATSGNLNSEISFASVQGDGTAVPALQSNGSILYYQPASGKAAGGYMTLTAVHGCKIDQVKVVAATHATNIKYSKDGGELSEASDEIAAGGEYLTPASLDAETVNIYCAGDDKNHRLYIAQVVVYYTGEAIPVHHKAIDITGMEASQFEFPKNGTFTHEGLKVYACYDENCNEKVEITADCHVEADLTTTGEKKAKVYYGEEFVDEYDINVIAGQENPALAYTPTSETIAAANVASWSAPAFSNPLNVSPISFSSNNTAVATVDENGVIALAGGYGTAKITASFEETEDYIASEATYTITVQEPANKIAGEWHKVTSTAEITVGSKVIIANIAEGTDVKTMGAVSDNGKYRLEVASTVDNEGILSAKDGTKTFTLVDAGNGLYAFQGNNGKYLSAAASSSNDMKEVTMIDANASWSISIEEGVATILAQGSYTHNWLRYNQTNTRFSCYASGQQNIALYVNRKEYVAPAVDPENPTPATPVAINTNVEEEEIVASGNVVVTVNTDNFEEPKSYIAQNGATIVINGNGAEEAKSVIADEQSTIQVNQPTTVNQVFSVSATMGAGLSGQITGVDNVTIAESTEAYFDITLGDNANPNKWHAIAVPFPVDAISGIYDAETGAKLNNEEHYAIMDYHGDIRAQGLYGWKKFRGIMSPGVFYLMTVDGNTKTFRFKMSGTTLPTATSLALQLYAQTSGDNKDGGWNGVANPTLQHGTVNQTVTVLNPNTYTYEDKDAGEMNFVVGTPFFIQANATIVSEGMEMGAVDGTKPYYAPKRVSENGFENIKVFFGNDEYKDKLTISANVEALNEYQIGKDLVKMTMTNTPSVAQIFGNAYNAKLCRVYAPMANDQAEYSLTLYAPNAGEYTISAPEMEDADIFLTYEGSIIWNLSMSDYTNDFAKGNNEGYGLILVKKAPQVITGVDNAEANEAGVQKVIINDHVYILRAEQMYDVTGKMVK